MERDLQLSLVSSIHNNDNHDGTIYAAMYVGLYPDCFVMSGICTSQQQCLQKIDCNSVLCSVGCDGQLPKETLSQLKQVLTSPFFNSVKEVYEHVYSTVDADINSSPELRVTATAKVCT